MRAFIKKIIRSLLLAPLVLVLLFEEWGWKPLALLFAKLAKLPMWAGLERMIIHLPPGAALLAFGVPVASLIPVKLLALYLFAQGHAVSGLVLLIAAKVLGTGKVTKCSLPMTNALPDWINISFSKIPTTTATRAAGTNVSSFKNLS